MLFVWNVVCSIFNWVLKRLFGYKFKIIHHVNFRYFRTLRKPDRSLKLEWHSRFQVRRVDYTWPLTVINVYLVKSPGNKSCVEVVHITFVKLIYLCMLSERFSKYSFICDEVVYVELTLRNPHNKYEKYLMITYWWPYWQHMKKSWHIFEKLLILMLAHTSTIIIINRENI